MNYADKTKMCEKKELREKANKLIELNSERNQLRQKHKSDAEVSGEIDRLKNAITRLRKGV